MAGDGALPSGVTLRQLTRIGDHRGSIVELDRESWHPDHTPAQWTLSVWPGACSVARICTSSTPTA